MASLSAPLCGANKPNCAKLLPNSFNFIFATFIWAQMGSDGGFLKLVSVRQQHVMIGPTGNYDFLYTAVVWDLYKNRFISIFGAWCCFWHVTQKGRGEGAVTNLFCTKWLASKSKFTSCMCFSSCLCTQGSTLRAGYLPSIELVL